MLKNLSDLRETPSLSKKEPLKEEAKRVLRRQSSFLLSEHFIIHNNKGKKKVMN